ncbi:MAG: hypothetical protein WCD16_06415 [Paracoccaceae bacterium]
MSGHTSSNRATILFDGPLEVDFIDLINELQRPFRNIALEFDETAVAEGSHAMFISEGMVVRISYGPKQDFVPRLKNAERPVNPRVSTAIVDALVQNIRASLVVAVEDGPSRSTPERTRLAACYHVVRHLLRRHEASLVHWGLSNTLFTAEEFESPAAMGASTQPARPERRRGARATARPDMAFALTNGAFAQVDTAVSHTHARLDENFARVVSEDEQADEESARLRATYPETGGREAERLRRERDKIFADDLIETRDETRRQPREEIGLIEQLTVYVMTVTIMVLSFPVGFAMLIYTVFRGENLTVTARAMALTGLGVGLASMDFTQAVSMMV